LAHPTIPSTLAEWLAYLEALHPKTIELGLERVAQVRDALALQPTFAIITVGGTNGKGSTCALLEAILTRAGFRVGCYTSPHLLRYNERVRVNAQAVDDAALCGAFAAVEAARGATSLTYFEYGTLAALWLFCRAQLDIAILEVGLGGRLDAVNAFDSDCAILTNVDLDHMDYLGANVEAIGREKAGIFRRQRPAVYADAAMPDSVRRVAADVGAELMALDQAFGYQQQAHARNQWEYWGPGGRRYALPLPALRGAYQLRNASACLTALDTLRARLPVAQQHIKQGLAGVELPGRFQVLPGRPVTILDVAHNPHAAQALAANLKAMGKFARTLAVFAMLKDKDIGGVIDALGGQVDAWYVGSIEAARGASGDALAQLLAARGTHAQSFANVAQALAAARRSAQGNDRIIVFGSFYTVAEALRPIVAAEGPA
jgi:dihydrofolate synthase / folylpolyglutamate synthase